VPWKILGCLLWESSEEPDFGSNQVLSFVKIGGGLVCKGGGGGLGTERRGEVRRRECVV
jgi:hypothetical protein